MADVRSIAPYEAGTPSILRPSPRTASRALYLSVVTMVASMVAISLFFGGAGAFWGPVNDLLVVATVLLLLPARAARPGLAREHVGRWLLVLSVAAAIGVAVVAVGQLALVAGLITLETSFATGGLGVLPVIAWIGATAVPALRLPVLGRAIAGWALAFLALIGLTSLVLVTLSTDTPTLTSVLGVPLMIVLVGWMVSLARGLGREASVRRT